MKKLSFLAFLALVVLVIPLSVVHAAQTQVGKTVTVSQTLSENAYLAGQEVYVSSTAEKDLLGAGGKITVNAPVIGDLMLTGGSVNILDSVGGDVRVAGGDVTVAKSVGGDLFVFGGTVTILPSATIGGDVIIFGGTVDMQGAVEGSLQVHAESVVVNGIVMGPASIKTSDSVSFEGKADFRSSLAYSAPIDATIAEGAKLGGEVVFTKEDGGSSNDKNIVAGILAFVSIMMLVKFVGILSVALVIVYAFKNASLTLSTQTIQKFWQMLGVGFVATIATPVAVILLLLSVVGMYVGFILLALYLFALLVAGVFMCITTGALLSKLIQKDVQVDWKWTLFGTIVVFALPFVPVLGWVAILVLFFASMGAVVASLWRDAQVKMKG
ncbi:hypothetical protein EPO14_02660 [Patescibacteria group bacterium]|nr:MAG: hypothetical protein EPO14_02660 [Patescibacteria group bacterium]